jgi:hypothetical protein
MMNTHCGGQIDPNNIRKVLERSSIPSSGPPLSQEVNIQALCVKALAPQVRHQVARCPPHLQDERDIRIVHPACAHVQREQDGIPGLAELLQRALPCIPGLAGSDKIEYNATTMGVEPFRALRSLFLLVPPTHVTTLRRWFLWKARASCPRGLPPVVGCTIPLHGAAVA